MNPNNMTRINKKAFLIILIAIIASVLVMVVNMAVSIATVSTNQLYYPTFME